MKQRGQSEGAGENIGVNGQQSGGRRRLSLGFGVLSAALAAVLGCSTQAAPNLEPVDELGSQLATLTTLTASGPVGTRHFGTQVAIEGDTAVVSAKVNNALYIFEHSLGVWSQAFMTDTNQSRGSWGVALDGDTVAIDSNAGVDVFVRSAGEWEFQQYVVPESPFSGAYSVALRGDTLAFGNPDSNGTAGNVVYVFTRSVGVWSLQQIVAPDDTTTGLDFGRSVALGSDLLLVGASQAKLPSDTEHFAGAAFVFKRTGSTWSQVQRIDPTELPDPESRYPHANFGIGVAVDRDATRAVISQNFPATVHGYLIVDDTLVPEASLATPGLGSRIATDGNLVVATRTVLRRNGNSYEIIGGVPGAGAIALSQGKVLAGHASQEVAYVYCAADCDDGLQCETVANCSSGHCVNALCCSTECEAPNESCVTEFTGVPTGTCAPIRDGIACESGDECGTGHCVQGVCCSEACDATTDSCLNVETGLDDGTCGPILEAVNCSEPEACGSGSCRDGVCCNDACSATNESCETSATGAAHGTCAPTQNGWWCQQDDACGSGHCSEGVCCDSVCEGTAQSCMGQDTGLANGTCGPAPNGVLCYACDTGFCAEGICCNTACDSPEESCHYNKTGLANGTCGPIILGAPCSNAAECESGYCVESACCDRECLGSDESCREANTGIPDGVCAAVQNGTSCIDDDECGSGNCREGVCCDSACSGTCESCRENFTGAPDGECAPIPEGQDPQNECEPAGAGVCRLPGTCNGERGCMTNQGVECGESSCASGSVQVNAATCDGEGSCNEAGTSECEPYRCDEGECQTSCAEDSDCLGSTVCLADECRTPVALGEACDGDRECGSGQCVDGVCCDSPCTGACESCLGNQTDRTDGRCAPIVGGGSPRVASACPASGEVCGADGKCDGDGACRSAAAKGTNCGTACEEGSEQARACDGFGQCATESVMSCLPYECVPGGNTCASRCEKDDDCAAGAACNRDTGKCAVANTTCKDKDTLLSPDGSETDCAPYHCAAGACRESCSTNNDCQTGFACKGDICRVIDEDEVSDVDAAAPMASSGPGAKTEAQSESGCGCRIGGASGQHSAGWVALLALGLEWRRRSSTTVIATLLSVLPGCKKVVQATVNEAEDTPPAASSRDNNDMQLVDCSDAAQPETHAGPTMVAVGRRDESCVWIDTTEVTAAQMLPFVQLPSAARVGRYPDGCTPSELLASDFMTGQMPAANVAWCDAVAFCAFAGKRLCDDKGKASEWQTVCTDGDHGQFAFDELADSELCRLDADAPVLVGSLDECRTPTGVVDLVGNVREWTAECSGSAPDVSCAVRGGSYLDGPSTSGCDASKSVARDRVAADIGFRCCADVP